MTPPRYTDQERRDFLKKLDAADLNVTDWEARFLGTNLSMGTFSPKQQEVIDRMIEKYGDKIRF